MILYSVFWSHAEPQLCVAPNFKYNVRRFQVKIYKYRYYIIYKATILFISCILYEIDYKYKNFQCSLQNCLRSFPAGLHIQELLFSQLDGNPYSNF